jgi:hypothetical protein
LNFTITGEVKVNLTDGLTAVPKVAVTSQLTAYVAERYHARLVEFCLSPHWTLEANLGVPLQDAEDWTLSMIAVPYVFVAGVPVTVN